ncbi:hypothetical protein BX616_010774 [Lobosporangium transversale]|nr:hypothetical protein BX616_010774 [Lobosporangium transversale]
MASGSNRVGNIVLGNCIGKGAFGSVWRGLNVETATTVAVKQINLSDIPSAELENIMHPNIVKYHGFEKTSDYLNIILELCENGSLRSLCKNFGKLPEHLGAMYITQVLDGLVYLHDQGVIHRDIKGANILATKDGLVKLADFGVATLSNDVGDMSVAGTPYWMAPEIIELSGATTASDIWSVGCTVIELLDGEPPYHNLPPMGALYRIVQDDHPPIPDTVSAIVQDFLMQCFQKDCNFRVSAKKLSKHPWIQMSRKKASGSQRSREKAIPAYEEAVKSVQQWNEALKGSTSLNRTSGNKRRNHSNRGGRPAEQGIPAIANIFHMPSSQEKGTTSTSPPLDQATALALPPVTFQLNASKVTNTSNYEPEVSTDNWDDDFADSILSFQLAAREFKDQEDEVSKTIRAIPRQLQQGQPTGNIDDCHFEENEQELRVKTKVKALEKKQASRQQEGNVKQNGSLASRTKASGPHVPIDLVRSRSAPGQLVLSPPLVTDEFKNYREEEEDDFSDLFDEVECQNAVYHDEGLTLQTRLSNHSWFGNDAGSDEEDPFAEVDEGFDEIDLEANIAREKYARIYASIAKEFRLLELQRPEKQLDVCDRLMVLLTENPDMRGAMIANHGVIPLLDLIENSGNYQNLTLKLLNILNLVIRNDFALQESLCLVGAIPVLIGYTSKRYNKDIQLAAAIFIQQICHTNSLTLQMFISCRGLRVFIDFLQRNYATQKEFVWIAISGIHNVFNLQSLTPRNDFCRLLAKQGLLDPLSSKLYDTMRDPQDSSYTEKIVQVLLIFSQGDSPVKELLATRQIVHRKLPSIAACKWDVCNHVLTTLFNMCRINKSRQEEAAQAGIIPHLQQIAESSSPLKQFALPILCDMAHAGRACRNILWHNDCLPVYLRLFKDPYWQVNAIDAVLVWLQDETVDVEQVLLQPSSLNLFAQAFLTAKANSFENILEPLYKIIRISPAIARGIAVPALFQRLLDRLSHPKPVVRSNLLRILKAIFDAHPERLQVVARYGITNVVAKIAEEDTAALVTGLAKEILSAIEESDSEAMLSCDERERENGSLNTYEGSSNKNSFFDLGPHKGPIYNLKGTQMSNKNTQLSINADEALGDERNDVDDLFQKEVDDLDVKTSMDPRRSSHQQEFGLEKNSEGVVRPHLNILRHYSSSTTQPARKDEESESSSSEEDHFVTSRTWSDDEQNGSHIATIAYKPTERTHIRVKSMQERDETLRPKTATPLRQFGHQKSRSLGEALETCFNGNVEVGQGALEDVHSVGLSESMILRNELPKIRLELLDLDRFPAWDRRKLEAEYENDDDGDSGSEDAARALKSPEASILGASGPSISWAERLYIERADTPRATRLRSLSTVDEAYESVEGFAEPSKRRGPSTFSRQLQNRERSRRNSTGTSSGESTVRLRGTALSSPISPFVQRNTHIELKPTPTPSAVKETIMSKKSFDEEDDFSISGLVLAERQEYGSTLNFSGDENDDSDNDDMKEPEMRKDYDGAKDDRDNDDNDDDDAYSSAEDVFDDNDDPNHDNFYDNDGGSHNDYDPNDLKENKVQTWNWGSIQEDTILANGKAKNDKSSYLMEEQEIDWDREEVRRVYETPVSPISPISPVTSTLRRRSSHRKSVE